MKLCMNYGHDREGRPIPTEPWHPALDAGWRPDEMSCETCGLENPPTAYLGMPGEAVCLGCVDMHRARMGAA